MRITTTQMYDNLLNGIQRQGELQAQGNAQISSGTRFQRPSEAGLDYKTSLDIRHAQASNKGSLDAAGVANLRLEVSQARLIDMQNILVRAQTLAVQLSSAQNGAQERTGGAIEVGHLLDQFLADGNQTWQGDSLFSGTAIDKDAFSNAVDPGNVVFTPGGNTSIAVSQTSNVNGVNDTYSIVLNAAGNQIVSITDSAGANQLPAPVGIAASTSYALNLSNGVVLSAVFDATAPVANADGGTLKVSAASAGAYVYKGNDQDRIVAVSDQQKIISNIRGDNPAFVKSLNALADFKTALENNDVAGLKKSLGDLIDSGEKIIGVNTEVGARIRSLMASEDAYTEMHFTLTNRLNDHEGVDVAAVVAQMQQASLAMQASYTQIANLKSLSLINFLR